MHVKFSLLYKLKSPLLHTSNAQISSLDQSSITDQLLLMSEKIVFDLQA